MWHAHVKLIEILAWESHFHYLFFYPHINNIINEIPRIAIPEASSTRL